MVSIEHDGTEASPGVASHESDGAERASGARRPDSVFELTDWGRGRFRTVMFITTVAAVVVTLPAVAADTSPRWPLVLASVAGLATLAVMSSHHGRSKSLMVNDGLPVAIILIFALVIGTGGATSPYEILYVPLVGFAAAFRGQRTFHITLAGAVAAALLPSVLNPDPSRLVIEVLAAGAVALTVAVVHRIAAGLRDANKLYLSVLENHAGPTYLLQPDGSLAWINEPAQRVLGLPLEQVVGTPWPDVVAQGEAERLMPAFHAAMNGAPQQVTVRTDAPGGRYLLEGTVFPVNRYGDNVGVMGIAQDITELHDAAFGADALRYVLDSLTTPVAVFDASTHARMYANDAAGQLTCHEDSDAPTEWESLEPQLVQELPGPGESRQVKLDAVGAELRQLEVSIQRLCGERDLLVYTAVDVTARERRERQLEQTAQRNRESARRLRQVDRLKDAFLTAVSHELRTPAAVILGAAKTLRAMPDADAATRHSLHEAMERHAERLTRLLTDLLNLRRLSDGTTRSDPEPFDIVQMARRIADGATQHGRITIDAPQQLVTHADPVQIERILENLLNNAAKHAPSAAVGIKVEPRKDGGFRLSVTDNGPGIPEDELERVFEPFYRIDLDSPQPGTGIGLALVAEFAAIHGGRAWAERVESGSGTRIVIDIPERRATGPDSAQGRTAPH